MKNKAGIIPVAVMLTVMIAIWAVIAKILISDIKTGLVTLEYSIAGLAVVIIVGGTLFTVEQTRKRNISRRTAAIAGFSTTTAAILAALGLSIVTGGLEGMPTRIIIISLPERGCSSPTAQRGKTKTRTPEGEETTPAHPQRMEPSGRHERWTGNGRPSN